MDSDEHIQSVRESHKAYDREFASGGRFAMVGEAMGGGYACPDGGDAVKWADYEESQGNAERRKAARGLAV